MGRTIGIDLGTTNSCVAYMENGEAVVIPNAEDEDDSLVWFYVEAKETDHHKFLSNMSQCGFDQYAYAVVYGIPENAVTAAADERGIYRIKLSDGSYEIIERNADSDTEVHVVSDDCIYIVQGKMHLCLYREHVYQFDYTTKNKEKLF